ncbi:hypothetical protein BpHYR1_013624 [Brachionus plicatilis]|uniref:Uncharacterized protein n=1 Tax=Brachionus plicatilis TaxID=10195 RepID=A0A3M7S3F2_BRAPC|nr:hypothetical protein BpHYR1_013624 [Brachionus plicatilis]
MSLNQLFERCYYTRFLQKKKSTQKNRQNFKIEEIKKKNCVLFYIYFKEFPHFFNFSSKSYKSSRNSKL